MCIKFQEIILSRSEVTAQTSKDLASTLTLICDLEAGAMQSVRDTPANDNACVSQVLLHHLEWIRSYGPDKRFKNIGVYRDYNIICPSYDKSIIKKDLKICFSDSFYK